MYESWYLQKTAECNSSFHSDFDIFGVHGSSSVDEKTPFTIETLNGNEILSWLSHSVSIAEIMWNSSSFNSHTVNSSRERK
jgi:hypothetical protein